MSKGRILVTGGAGFIGSHIVDRLLQEGYAVRVLDNLTKPTHEGIPSYLSKEAEFLEGDVRNPRDWNKALRGVQGVFHEAAAGGFTADISLYAMSNSYGTALLMEKIASGTTRVEKVVVASSVAVYGEGRYLCQEHGAVHPDIRRPEALQNRRWEQICPQGRCGLVLRPCATPESKPVSPEKMYSVSKFDQERTVLAMGRELGLHAVALRYFLTYGPRQSLHNPYTGICSIFTGQLSNGVAPRLFEDGGQVRDFVYVSDVAEANWMVYNQADANGRVFNVGTGEPTSIRRVAQTLGKLLGNNIPPLIGGHYRLGEVRHIFSDIGQLKALGFRPKIGLEEGLKRYTAWLGTQGKIEDRFSKTFDQLLRDNVVLVAREETADA